MMRYNDSLTTLVRDVNDPRWIVGNFNHLLEQRLASEHGRLIRIVHRIEEVVRYLTKLLGIKDGDVRIWNGS